MIIQLTNLSIDNSESSNNNINDKLINFNPLNLHRPTRNIVIEIQFLDSLQTSVSTTIENL